MKWIASLLIAGTCLSQSVTIPPSGFQIPFFGTPNWDKPIVYDLTLMNSYLNGTAIPGRGVIPLTSTPISGNLVKFSDSSGNLTSVGTLAQCVSGQFQIGMNPDGAPNCVLFFPYDLPSAFTYGAKGDFTADDTAAITAYVSAVCMNGGGYLYFPHPSVAYRISSAISVPCSNVTMYGDGQGSSIIKAAPGAYISMFFDFVGGNVAIRGLTFDGNVSAGGSALFLHAWSNATAYAKYNSVIDGAGTFIALSAPPTGTATSNATYWLPMITGLNSGQQSSIISNSQAFLLRSSHTSVENVEIKNTGSFGILYTGATTYHEVTGNYIHDLGVAAQGNSTVVAGIWNVAGTLSHVLINHNFIAHAYPPTYGPGVAGAIGIQASDVTVSDNDIYDCLQVGGGTVTTGLVDSTVSHAVLGNNRIYQDTTLNSDSTGGLEELGRGISITGNTIVGVTGAGVNIGSTSPASGDVTVTGNVISGYDPSLGNAGVVLGYTNSDAVFEVNVSDNHIGNMAYGTYVRQAVLTATLQGNQCSGTVTTCLTDLSGKALTLLADPAARVFRITGGGISPWSSWTGGFAPALTNTTALTNLYSANSTEWAMPAGVLNFKGTTAHIKFGGLYSSAASSPGTMGIGVVLGSTTICQFDNISLPTSSTGVPFSGDAQFIIGTTGASGSIVCSGGTLFFGGSNSGNGQITGEKNIVTSSFNTTSGYNFDIWAQFSVASTSNSMQISTSSIRFEYPSATSF